MLFETITRPSVYRKFGDVNPIEHGGGLWRKIGETEFEIVHIRASSEEELYWYNIVIVDVNDSFVQKDKEIMFDIYDLKSENNIDFAIACIEYFGIENFGGHWDHNYAISYKEAQKLYNTISSENFIDNETTIRCRVINYFDVWGNDKDGYTINNQCNEGELTVPKDATNRGVMNALKKFGFLKKHVRMNMIQFESAYIDIWMINDSKGKPFCCVEPIIEG